MALSGEGKVALITGASSGIGAASARALARAGFHLALGARRVNRLEALADEIEAEVGRRPLILDHDVTSLESCTRFVEKTVRHFGKVNVLLNNAGLALGVDYVADVKDETEWQTMIDTNIMGVLRMSRLVIPYLEDSGCGHIINLGSIAGREAYAGGAVYCATKFAVRAITDALRQELLGKPIRVTTIDPGMVETEFSVVRYRGDKEKADNVYAGMTPLTAEDIADCIVFAATRPSHVNIDAVIVKPLDQAGAGKVARKS
jgi:3-hydroxy acid dehydrogenase / malonic semialdehyde reductase